MKARHFTRLILFMIHRLSVGGTVLNIYYYIYIYNLHVQKCTHANSAKIWPNYFFGRSFANHWCILFTFVIYSISKNVWFEVLIPTNHKLKHKIDQSHSSETSINEYSMRNKLKQLQIRFDARINEIGKQSVS